MFAREVLVWLYNAINHNIASQQFAVVSAVKNVAYSIIFHFILIAVGKRLDHRCALKKGLEARNNGDIYEEASCAPLSCVAGLVAKRAILAMLILAGVCNTGIDAAVIVHWLNTSENCKLVEDDPFRVY